MSILTDTIRRLARPLEPEPTGIEPHTAPLSAIRAVLFDVYGTLFISASGDIGTLLHGDRSSHLVAALTDAGLDGRLDEAAAAGIRRFHDAIRETHAALRARGTEYPEIDVQRIWAEVLTALGDEGLITKPSSPAHVSAVAVSYEMRANPVWPMPGTHRLLDQLSSQGWPLGIVSNAQFYTPLLFEALLDGTPESLGFDPELCAWSWQAGEAKPSTRLFAGVLRTLESRKVPAGQVLYVGNDMLNDMAAAAEAGCRTALFAGDRRSLRLRQDHARCAGLRPDRTLTRIGDVAQILGLNPDQ